MGERFDEDAEKERAFMRKVFGDRVKTTQLGEAPRFGQFAAGHFKKADVMSEIERCPFCGGEMADCWFLTEAFWRCKSCQYVSPRSRKLEEAAALHNAVAKVVRLAEDNWLMDNRDNSLLDDAVDELRRLRG